MANLSFCIIPGTTSFIGMQTFYHFYVLKYITVTAPGQSFNIEVGNRGREQNKGKKKERKRKQGRFRIQKNSS